MNLFEEIAKWYFSQCDGEWEHCHGIELKTLPYPAWSFCFNTEGTELEKNRFLKQKKDEDSWHFCLGTDTSIEGYCEPKAIAELIKNHILVRNESVIEKELPNDLLSSLLYKLLNDEKNDWKNGSGVQINTLDNPGWQVNIYGFQNLIQNKSIEEEKSDIDWMHCSFQNGIFNAACGPLNLAKVVEVFLNWVNFDRR